MSRNSGSISSDSPSRKQSIKGASGSGFRKQATPPAITNGFEGVLSAALGGIPEFLSMETMLI